MLIKNNYSNLSKPIYIIIFSRIINSFGNFIGPFLTLLLTQKSGISIEKTGFILTIAIIFTMLGSLIGGVITDKFGRKKVIIICSIISSMIIFTCVFVERNIIVSYLLIAALFFNAIIKISTNALVLDITNNENRKSTLVLFYYVTNIGMAFGPMLAGFLFRNHLNLILLIDAITTIISAALIAILVEDNYTYVREKSNSISSWYELKESMHKYRELFLYLLTLALLNIIYIQNIYSVPAYINEVFNNNGNELYGSLNMINCIIVLIFTLIIRKFIESRNIIFNTILSSLLYLIGFGGIFLSNSYYQIYLATIIYSIGEIIISISSQIYIAENTPYNYRGRFNSISSFIIGIGTIIGPTLAGVYLKFNDINKIYIFIFLIFILIMFFISLLFLLQTREASNSKFG